MAEQTPAPIRPSPPTGRAVGCRGHSVCEDGERREESGEWRVEEKKKKKKRQYRGCNGGEAGLTPAAGAAISEYECSVFGGEGRPCPLGIAGEVQRSLLLGAETAKRAQCRPAAGAQRQGKRLRTARRPGLQRVTGRRRQTECHRHPTRQGCNCRCWPSPSSPSPWHLNRPRPTLRRLSLPLSLSLFSARPPTASIPAAMVSRPATAAASLTAVCQASFLSNTANVSPGPPRRACGSPCKSSRSTSTCRRRAASSPSTSGSTARAACAPSARYGGGGAPTAARGRRPTDDARADAPGARPERRRLARVEL